MNSNTTNDVSQWAVVSVFPASRKPAKIIAGYVFDKREDAENALWMDFAPEPGSKYSNYTVAPVCIASQAHPTPSGEQASPKAEAQGADCKHEALGEIVLDDEGERSVLWYGGLSPWVLFDAPIGTKLYTAPVPPDSILTEIEELAEKWRDYTSKFKPHNDQMLKLGYDACADELMALVGRHRKGE